MRGDGDDQYISFIRGARQDPQPWDVGMNGPPTQPWAALTDERLIELDQALPPDRKVAPVPAPLMIPEPPQMPSQAARRKPRSKPNKPNRPKPEALTRTQARLARRRRRRMFMLGCGICALGWILLIAYVVV